MGAGDEVDSVLIRVRAPMKTSGGWSAASDGCKREAAVIVIRHGARHFLGFTF